MLPSFHPGAHRSGKWTCCLQADRPGNPAFITTDTAETLKSLCGEEGFIVLFVDIYENAA